MGSPFAFWSESEKKLSRRIFEAALEAELNEVMAEFKSRAAAAGTPEAMWALEEYLAQKRREIDGKYDYRYSMLAGLAIMTVSASRRVTRKGQR